jgi:hypothetical protein
MWHRPVLPALRPHKRLLLRTVVLGRKKANNRMHVLVSEKTAAHLPVADTNPVRSVHSTLKRFLTEIFGAEIPQHKVTFFTLSFFLFHIKALYIMYIVHMSRNSTYCTVSLSYMPVL